MLESGWPGMKRTSRGSARKPRPWTRWALAITGLVFTLLLPRDVAANCQNLSTTQSVSAGQNLAQIIEKSTAPCALSVGPGTYDAAATTETSDLIFRISSGITVRSTTGPGSTTLRVSSGKTFALVIQALNGRCPNGATLEGFTLTGGLWGVLVQALQTACPGDQITGVTLRNLIINTDTVTLPGGNGIGFVGVQNSVIDSTTINSARENGIFLAGGSNNNLVMNNTIVNTVVGHAIAVQGSSDNVVVANTITGSAFDGILLNSSVGPSLSGTGSSRNRIERNTISGHRTDGVTLTDASRFNYVGRNVIVSSAYDPITKPNPSPTSGVGVWVNNGSSGNYLFGNDLSGSPENGIDVLTSKSTYLQANKVHANLQGGIWVANYGFDADPGSPVPQDTVIHGNNIYFNTMNGMVNLEGTSSVDVAYNHLSGVQSGASTLAGTNTTGVFIHEGGLSTRGANLASSSVNVYENTITDVNNRAFITGTTTNTQFFRNRFLNGANNPNAPPGRQGLTYPYSPASIQWDGSRTLGGNHWSEFSAANGNPDLSHQYKGFVYDLVHGLDGNGPYADRFPYQSAHLGAPYATYSVSTVEPVAGSVLATGTTKTVRWIARGCTFVDIYYGSGSLGPTLITSGYPNVGFYAWTVPAVPFRADYYVQVACLDSNLAPAALASSAPFTIAANDLVLLNPGRGFRAVDGGTIRVAWKKSAAVANVNIFVKSAAGVETQVATNASGTFLDVTLPPSVSDSGHVTIRIQDASNSARQDSVDGYFMVRGGAPSFTTPLAGQSLQIGSIQVLEWNGLAGSFTVDLDLYENDILARSIVKNLPDFGNYTWFVPEAWSTNSKIRMSFKDASGTTLGSVDSGTFRVCYTNTPGVLVSRYRLYSPVTLEHLYTTDLNEYNVLGQSGVWQQEGVASQMHNGPATIGGVAAVPYYRLYDKIARWHHWTTDLNEYTVLGANTGRYDQEGIDGYIFKTQVPGTVPFYRLLFKNIAGLHHWTADQNERDTLVGGGAWVEESREYVFPPSTTTTPTATLTQTAVGALPVLGATGAANDVAAVGGRAGRHLLDLNGDGVGDVFLYNPATGAWRAEVTNPQTGGFTEQVGAWVPSLQVYPAQLNADAFTDVVVYDPVQGTWAQARNAGDGSFTYTSGAWEPGWTVVPADLDGDGLTDLALYHASTGAWVTHLVDGAGGFTEGTAGNWDPGWTITAADLTGDGRDDLLLYNAESGAWLEAVSQAGAATFDYPASGLWTPGWKVSPADLDGDGRTDLVLLNATGAYARALGRADGGFAPLVTGQWDAGASITTGDLNADGLDDVFVSTPATGGWVEALSDGTGEFTTVVGQAVPGYGVTLTDIDADGAGDVLFTRADGVWVLGTNTGVGTFTYTQGSWGSGWTVFTRMPPNR